MSPFSVGRTIRFQRLRIARGDCLRARSHSSNVMSSSSGWRARFVSWICESAHPASDFSSRRQRLEAQQRRQQVPRRRQVGGREHARPPDLVDDGHAEALLQVHGVTHTKAVEKADVLRAATEEHVLPVVDGDAGRVGVGVRAPAEERPLLQQRYGVTGVSKLAGCRESGNTAARDRDCASRQETTLRTSSLPASASLCRPLRLTRSAKDDAGVALDVVEDAAVDARHHANAGPGPRRQVREQLAPLGVEVARAVGLEGDEAAELRRRAAGEDVARVVAERLQLVQWEVDAAALERLRRYRAGCS